LAIHTPARRFVDRPPATPFWQYVHREADRLYPQLRETWDKLFRDFRTGFDPEALEAVIRRGNLFEVEALIALTWDAEAASVARYLLPPLFREAVERTALALIPATAASLEMPPLSIAFNVAAPEVLQAIDLYAGEQIVAIGERTRMAVRQVIREGFTSGGGMSTQIRGLKEILGLTPAQARGIRNLRARLERAGATRQEIEQQAGAAARKALRLRVRTIARTESISATSLGQQALWEQLAREGLVTDEYKRHWIITPDDRLCARCQAIPRLNPAGVGLNEPFVSENGTIFLPPLHSACRCAVSLRHRNDAASEAA
jgi:hypothetical protein